MWAGSSRSTADEWIELWNQEDAPFSLNGYRILGIGGGTVGLTLGTSDVIGPHQAFVIANYDANEGKSVLAVTPQVVTTTISIPNDHLEITLVDSSGTIVDHAGNGGSPAAGASGAFKVSMLRQSPITPGERVDAWMDATTSKGFDPGILDRGTPGFCDNCFLEVSVTTLSTSTSILSSSSSSSYDVVLSSPSSSEVSLSAASSSEPTTSVASSTSTPPPLSPLPPPAPVRPTPPAFRPRLNEIFPHPSSGNEWIEIANVSSSQRALLLDWTLEDGRGVIAQLTSSTLASVNSSHPLFFRVALHSHVLNNTGDVVRLKNLAGTIMDEMSYESTGVDATVIRMPDIEGAWFTSLASTPGAPNVLVAPNERTSSTTSTSTTATSTPRVRDALVHHDNPVQSSTSSSVIVVSIPFPELPAAPSSTPPVSMAVSSTHASSTRRPPTHSTHPKKSSSMTSDPTIPRVRISGIVGTVPGILAKNQFVIHTQDGRGLLVKATGKQPSPAFGTFVAVTGQLITNDSGTHLRMYARDRWVLRNTHAETQPRTVDVEAPSEEDDWSLMEVTGTVRETQGSRVGLELGDARIILQIRPAVGYRAERLQNGDTLRVRGVVDTRRDPPVLYPRQNTDITLVAHAPTVKPAAPTNAFPAWTPFGAAGLAMATTEGFRQFQKRREKRHLEQLLKKATERLTMPSSIQG